MIINEKEVFFNGEKNIFINDIFYKDDNVYFKYICVVFGVYFVNLSKDKNNDKWFVSWFIIGIYENYDVVLYFYNVDLDKDDIIFGFKFLEINEFFRS